MATAVVTFDQAVKAVDAESKKRNSRIIEQVPHIIDQLAKEKALYIFNVSPKSFSRNLGSLGTFFVPGCEKGEDVSAPLMIPGVLLERVANDMHKMGNRYEEGMDVARDVMFQGRGYAPELNRERFGMFISDSPEPTKKQISAAKAMLRQNYAKLVDEADAYDRNNKRDQITEMHREAATCLGVTKAWMSQEPREAADCPACHKRIDIESILCPHCEAILDIEGAKQYHPEKYLAYQRANEAAKK